MCLAIPMKVVAVKGDSENIFEDQIATVEADGIQQEVRLDVVDRWPEPGDYLIIHAGFALHTLDEEDGLKNLQLLQEMVAAAPSSVVEK